MLGTRPLLRKSRCPKGVQFIRVTTGGQGRLAVEERHRAAVAEDLGLRNLLLTENLLGGLCLKTLAGPDSDTLGAPVDIQEVKAAFKALVAGITQGTDGLPPEFYQRFVGALSPRLEEMYLEAYKKGELLTSSRKAVVIPLPKSLLFYERSQFVKEVKGSPEHVMSSVLHFCICNNDADTQMRRPFHVTFYYCFAKKLKPVASPAGEDAVG
ncbi:hypothetical protein NDU88_006316 [Pleurodeles waltl]|uniref:Uncharacterized protein n=1 Tax=Pleurodeles waltl TaxID=8319 RepID=A0AAV7X3U1_PLEWA|nr:hypothetical protein NDU88_006316 [Pleurodeles waltl]